VVQEGDKRPVAATLMSEKQLLNNVIDAAQKFGWYVVHFRPAWTGKGWRTAMQGDKGFPDIVLARKGVVWFFELKVQEGAKWEEGQREWAAKLGDRWRLIQPSHWLSGEVERLLMP
jgi:hypothetical protein